MDGVKEAIASSMNKNGMDGRIRDRGQVESVELMRLDLEGSKTMAAPFTAVSYTHLTLPTIDPV